jgi:hypothetical protein
MSEKLRKVITDVYLASYAAGRNHGHDDIDKTSMDTSLQDDANHAVEVAVETIEALVEDIDDMLGQIESLNQEISRLSEFEWMYNDLNK